ncbi:hypothetical protein ACWKSR_11160, partial [Campylobacter fetus subsp. venerealis]
KKLVQKENARLHAKVKNAPIKVSHSKISNFRFLRDIRDWNMGKGYNITIDEDRLVRQVSEYPDRYFLTTVCSNGIEIGYSLGVKLTSDSIYYY